MPLMRHLVQSYLAIRTLMNKTNQSGLPFPSSLPVLYELRTHHVLENVVEQRLGEGVVQFTLQRVRPVPICHLFMSQVPQRPPRAVLWEDRHYVSLLVEGHRGGDLRRADREDVNFVAVLVAESSGEEVDEGLGGGVDVVKGHRDLACEGSHVNDGRLGRATEKVGDKLVGEDRAGPTVDVDKSEYFLLGQPVVVVQHIHPHIVDEDRYVQPLQFPQLILYKGGLGRMGIVDCKGPHFDSTELCLELLFRCLKFGLGPGRKDDVEAFLSKLGSNCLSNAFRRSSDEHPAPLSVSLDQVFRSSQQASAKGSQDSDDLLEDNDGPEDFESIGGFGVECREDVEDQVQLFKLLHDVNIIAKRRSQQKQGGRS